MAAELVRLEGHLCLRTDSGSVSVDWVGGSMGYRRRRGGGRSQAIARALGLHRRNGMPRVVDLTAGLGRDAFLLATLGCEVLALERSRWIHPLLVDGLARAESDPDTCEALDGRLHLLEADALEWLRGGGLQRHPADILYLDPMHPPRRKAALQRKEMRVFRDAVGEDPDQAALLQAALQQEVERVVVKRPAHAEPLAPGVRSSVSGRTTRFDVYAPAAG